MHLPLRFFSFCFFFFSCLCRHESSSVRPILDTTTLRPLTAMERICSSANLLVNFDDDDEHERREEDKLVKLPMWHGESARPLYSVSSKDLPSLRDTLTNKNWLVTPVYSTVNIKYVCQREEFDKKVVEHFQRTQAYVCIQERFTTCDMSVSHTLRTLVKLVQSELCRLLHQNKITCVQYRRLMRYHVEDNRLSSLIFVFDTHQVSVSRFVFVLPLFSYSISG